MPKFLDSPSGARPPRLERTIALFTATMLVVGAAVLVWRRGRETPQDVIPEASARAQVAAAHAREEAMA
jgi:hypothetical protein